LGSGQKPGRLAERVGLLEGGDPVVGEVDVESGDSVGQVVLFGDADDGCVDHGVFCTHATATLAIDTPHASPIDTARVITSSATPEVESAGGFGSISRNCGGT
jgi:hypothetical protein